MKKTNLLIALLLLSASLLAGEAFNVTAEAFLSCDDLTNCCSTENCPGSGKVNGCVITCATGTVISCPGKTKQGCP